MPTPRRYANQAQRQAAYRQRMADARKQELQVRGLPPLPLIPTMPSSRRWEAMNQQALRLLQTVEEEMQDYYDQRSEPWQGSERGEAMAERLQALQEVISAVEELA